MTSCFSCGKVLGKHDETVTTDSGFTLHRACLKKLLDTKPKADDQVCERILSLSILLLKEFFNPSLYVIEQKTRSVSILRM